MVTLTQSSLAKRLKVSQQTVSLCFTKPEMVAERTRRRVLRGADRLGYRPNSAARQMRARRFGAVAVVSRPTIGLMHHNVIKGLGRGLARHDIHLLHAELDLPRGDRGQVTPRLMRELCVDGLVVDDAADISPELVEQVESLGMPVLWINTAGDHDCVDPDDADAARRLTRAVIEAGHRRIAFLGPTPDETSERGHYSTEVRVAAHARTMRDAGLQPMVLHDDVVDSVEDAARLLREHPEVTAWVCQDDHKCVWLMLAAERLGLRVPGDLSIAGFRNYLGPMEMPFRITAMENDMLSVGEAAARMLLKKIKHPAEKLPVELVPWLGPIGQTLAAPRQGGA